MRQTNSDITGVLRQDSEELARIQHSFHLRFQLRPQLGLPAISITYFFEELPTPHLGVVSKLTMYHHPTNLKLVLTSLNRLSLKSLPQGLVATISAYMQTTPT